MKKQFLFQIFIVTVCVMGFISLGAAADTPKSSKYFDPSKPQRDFVHKYKNMEYWILFPDDYGKEDQQWPLVMFLHGAGERGKSMASLKRNASVNFLDPLKTIDDYKHLPFIVVVPHCPARQYWMPSHLYGVLKDVLSYCSVDEKRLYLTGHSLGGFGTWRFASAYPNLFAAIVPVSGGGQNEMVNTLSEIPTWAFHGEKDTVVPLRRSTALVNGLKRIGGDVKLTVLPKQGHSICLKTYNRPELWNWMLSQENESVDNRQFAEANE